MQDDLLDSYGWSRRFRARLDRRSKDLLPGRVIRTTRGEVLLLTDEGRLTATLSGRQRHRAWSEVDLPVVGDWVGYRPTGDGAGRVEAVLDRQNQLSRTVAGGRTVEQVVAANVDQALLVMGLDRDFNLRRLERFLSLVEESGARSAVVLNKSDLCDDLEERVAATHAVSGGRPVVVSSAATGDVESLECLLRPRETNVLLGSSGVGKSTLINRLRNSDEIRTAEVRSHDSRGRHTTTHRELFRLPGGSLLIDSPGVREIQLWGGTEALDEVFGDVAEWAEQCRFSDCRHDTEPGCAVRAAIDRGELDRDRLESVRRLEREASALERRKDVRAARANDRKLTKYYRSVQRSKTHRR